MDESRAAAVGDRGALDARVDAALGGPAGDRTLWFGLAEARYRTSFDPALRDRALGLADGLLAQGKARHCDVALRAAWLAGERDGKPALIARAQDLARDAELVRDQTCAMHAHRLLESFGVRPSSLGVVGAAPRALALEPIFDEESARVVITLSSDTKPEVLRGLRVHDDRLSAGTVTSVRLSGVVAEGIARTTAGSGLVRSITTAAVAGGSDVRFELGKPGERRVHFLLEPPRVIIDLVAARPHAAGRTARRVVLDAGHGGFDPGAIGPNGLREKDVTLDVVLRASRLLREQGFDVRTTRDDDRAVPIEHRSAQANAADAALFVSVHCNASESAHGHGIETYVLDATREAPELRLAARENGGSQDAAAALSMLLAETRGREHAQGSRALARLLQDDAVRSVRAQHAGVKDGGVHPAAFSVLVGARMPAVLFETSYLSNAEESARLATPSYRQTLAESIARAVGKFAR